MISNFYKKTISERRKLLTDETFTAEDMKLMAGRRSDELKFFDKMSENVIGSCRLPLGVLTGIFINGREHKVAMATEEPSVIAAANRAAKVFNSSGGVNVEISEPVTMAQIFLYMHHHPDHSMAAAFAIQLELEAKRWIKLANEQDPTLIRAGGGAFELAADDCHP